MTSSVDSRISPKRYESILSEIEEEDQNIKSELYELSIYDHMIHISPGKTIQDDEIKDLVYCYVYVVKNDKVVQKLGVYERFTKEKEPFFDLSTFGKGTLCLFEKYETNPSIFLEFKTDVPVTKPETKKKKPKSKVETVAEPVEVDLNAPEPVEVDLNAPEPNEVDLNALEPVTEPNEVDLNALEPVTEPVEVDLNAPEKVVSNVPKLLDTSSLERDLGMKTSASVEPETKPKKTKPSTEPSEPKIKLKKLTKMAETKMAETKMAETKTAQTKTAQTKAETPIPSVEPETKVETKPKTRTKKAKPILTGTDIPGTKFG
jgi:hypothetical protein